MSTSRKKNTIRNALSLTLNRCVGLLIPFVMRTIIIKVLGEQYLGLSNLFTSILQVLSLADLGFNSAIVYSMYKPIAEGDKKQICSLLCLFRRIYLFIGVLIACVGLCVIPFLDELIKGSYPNGLNITALYLMYLANTVISYIFFADRKALLTAHQRSDIENNINSITQIFFDVIKIIILLLLKDYYLYVLFLPITTFTSGLCSYLMSMKMYPYLKPIGYVDQYSRNSIIKRVFAISIQRFGNTISTSLDSVVISSFIGLTAVAIYGNYFYIVSSLISFAGGAIASATASIGNSIVTEKTDKNFEIFKKINMINQWFLIWSIPCLACLYQYFMNLWVGDSLMADMTFVWLMIVYFYLAQSRRVVQVYKDAAGLWLPDKWRPIVGCLVNLLFNVISVRYIGIHGVILSTVISYLFVEIPWETIILFRFFFNGNLKRYILDNLGFLACIIITTFVGMTVCSLMKVNGISGFFVRGIICFVEANIVFVMVYKNTNEFKYLKETLLGKLIKSVN